MAGKKKKEKAQDINPALVNLILQHWQMLDEDVTET